MIISRIILFVLKCNKLRKKDLTIKIFITVQTSRYLGKLIYSYTFTESRLCGLLCTRISLCRQMNLTKSGQQHRKLSGRSKTFTLMFWRETVLGLNYLARPGLLSTPNINSEVGPEFPNSPFNAVSKLPCFFYLQTKFILLLITLRLRY